MTSKESWEYLSNLDNIFAPVAFMVTLPVFFQWLNWNISRSWGICFVSSDTGNVPHCHHNWPQLTIFTLNDPRCPSNESGKYINRCPVAFTITLDLSGDLWASKKKLAGLCIFKVLSASVATKSFKFSIMCPLVTPPDDLFEVKKCIICLAVTFSITLDLPSDLMGRQEAGVWIIKLSSAAIDWIDAES